MCTAASAPKFCGALNFALQLCASCCYHTKQKLIDFCRYRLPCVDEGSAMERHEVVQRSITRHCSGVSQDNAMEHHETVQGNSIRQCNRVSEGSAMEHCNGHYCCAYTSVRVVMLCPCGSGWNAVWYSLQNLFHVKKVLLVVHERQFCVKDIGENGCKLHHRYICSSEIVQLWACS